MFIFIVFSSFLFGEQSVIGGYIKFDLFYNSRQIVAAREGHYYLYPQPISSDEDGIDQNIDPFFNMANFQSRVWLKLKSESIIGALVTGKLEADFFGASSGLENVFRLRHAFIKMSWTQIEILFGQYWSPLFTIDVFPQVVNFNTGVPFQPFARFPQVSLKWKMTESLRLEGAVTMQRDAFQEISGREVQQRSGLPGTHFHSIWEQNKFLVGAGGYSKALRPEKGGDIFFADSYTIYSKWNVGHFNVRCKYIFGNNLSDHIMLGGYVEIENNDLEEINYYPTMLQSSWMDIEYIYSNVTLGLFTGYTENNGIDYEVRADDVEVFKARSPNILYVFRISPRIVWKMNSIRFALEYDRTEALYTSEYTNKLKPKILREKPVVNDRLLFAINLFF
ncbi:MAG: hypothetical protein H8E56_12065 [Candidatus Marinimicrobia bacterium]|nr:hypothetical protein [Candidatus Neomarinimicrobiota bacterium]